MACKDAKPAGPRKPWHAPRLERLTVDLKSIAGNQAPCGDNARFNGKNLPCS